MKALARKIKSWITSSAAKHSKPSANSTQICIDEVAVSEGSINIRGWAFSGDFGELTALRLSIGGIEIIRPVPVSLLPSPDVMDHFAGLESASNCRFSVSVPVLEGNAADFPPLKNTFLAVTPIFSSGVGFKIFAPLSFSVALPAPELIQGIGGGFLSVAFAFLGHFVRFAGLTPKDRVLDVGCGCGRMAYSLGTYLDYTEGSYHGFDIVSQQINSAKATIGKAFPQLSFEKVDVYNRWYNPEGVLPPDGFTFPYPDKNFTFAFLTSVFTHMLPKELRHYLSELARVTEPGGRIVITAFLLNNESLAYITEGRSRVKFNYALPGCKIADPKNPEGAVAYDEQELFTTIHELGFEVVSKHYGHWSGRPDFLDYQDLLVLKRI